MIATDADLPALALSYRITGGPDAGLFALDLSSGVLRFLGAPDFEKPADADKNNVYVVEVTADENDGSTATPPTNRTAQQTINVTVTDVPAETPMIGLKTTPANATEGTSQAVLVGTDATFTMVGNTSLAGAVLKISGGGIQDQLFFVNDGLLVSSKPTKVRTGNVPSTSFSLSKSGSGVLLVVGTGGVHGNPGKRGVPLVLTFNATATEADVQNLLRGLKFDSSVRPPETHTLTVQLTNVGATPANGTIPAIPGVNSNLAELKIILVKSFDPGK